MAGGMNEVEESETCQLPTGLSVGFVSMAARQGKLLHGGYVHTPTLVKDHCRLAQMSGRAVHPAHWVAVANNNMCVRRWDASPARIRPRSKLLSK
jgi:hypothetical protein